MPRTDRNLWIASAVGLASVVLVTVGMTIMVIARISASVAPAASNVDRGETSTVIWAQLSLGGFIAAWTVFALAQIMARRRLVFENDGRGIAALNKIVFFGVFVVILTAFYVKLMGDTVEIILQRDPSSITSSSYFHSLGSLATQLALMWSILANMCFERWRFDSTVHGAAEAFKQ